MAINSVNLVGRLVQDPTIKTVGNDLQMCQFTLAVDKRGKDKGTNFIDCVAWGKTAETIAQYVKKGNQFGVSGRLDHQVWEKDGQRNSKVSVIVDDFTFIGGGEKKTPSEEVGLYDQAPKDTSEIDLSQIPF